MPNSSPSPNVSVQIFEELTGQVDGGWIGKIAAATLVEVGGYAQGLSVVIADDETVAELNRTHRGLDETTDVLSFSYSHSGTYYGDDAQEGGPATVDDFVLPPEVEQGLGEIVISFPQAERQATQVGHTVQKELVVLLAHGILHLLGYDHEENEEAAEMKNWEQKASIAIVSAGLLQESESGK